MCRNIRPLHNFEPPATRDEMHAAAVQYVRKISGTSKPSQANQAAFDEAVAEVTAATRHLLEHLTTNAPPTASIEISLGENMTLGLCLTPPPGIREVPSVRPQNWPMGLNQVRWLTFRSESASSVPGRWAPGSRSSA